MKKEYKKIKMKKEWKKNKKRMKIDQKQQTN